MEYSIETIISFGLLVLHIVLLVHALALAFVEPLVFLSLFNWLMPAILFLTTLWLILHLFPTILTTILKITINCITLIFAHVVTLIGTIATFIAGLGEAAMLVVQAWIDAKLAILAQGVESLIMLLGFGIETGHWLIDGIVSAFSLGGATLTIGAHFLGSILVALGYGFGSIVIVLLNLVTAATAAMITLVGAAPNIGMLAGGAVALLALPFIVKILVALIAHIIHLASLIILRLTLPIWGGSWLLGWITKMLVACVTLAFYLERSLKHRPTITLSWNDKKNQWAVSA